MPTTAWLLRRSLYKRCILTQAAPRSPTPQMAAAIVSDTLRDALPYFGVRAAGATDRMIEQGRRRTGEWRPMRTRAHGG